MLLILQKSSIQQKQYAKPILNQLVYLSEHYGDKEFQQTVTTCAALLLSSDPIANMEPIAMTIAHKNFSVLTKVSCLEWIVQAAKYLAGVVVSGNVDSAMNSLNNLLSNGESRKGDETNSHGIVGGGLMREHRTVVKRPTKLRQLYSTKLVYRNMFNEVVETFTAPIFQLMFPDIIAHSQEQSSSSSTTAANVKTKNFSTELETYLKHEILEEKNEKQQQQSSSSSSSLPAKSSAKKKVDSSGVDHIILIACFATLRELVALTNSES